ncbi:MAG: hypothetical protein EX269_06420 [Acidimicrobiales bacterium]|nr:MAG: hypothetical protein EX269_06420 [Acidimicrobiales bacterium]
MSPGNASHCVGCGLPLTAEPSDGSCAGCLPAYDPPHHCPQCGAWVGVRVTPIGWSASCNEHGDLHALS